ncbi:MAG: 30S ribosomal protein S12 methylthiotransferase RimO [Defluviitaleaceae bacterium]|nr:30S ribosomal protein S12 methylthiotransferase RimO [Defluviitaleaceae bacterium]
MTITQQHNRHSDKLPVTDLKISFVSLGCDKNLVDSEIMLGLVEREGYVIAEEYESDVIIINTCGFLMDATKEGIDHILRLASYKKSGACKALIVTGCMAQRYKKEIFEELPEVDAVVGTTSFNRIVQVIKEVMAGKQVAYLTDKNTPMPEEMFMLRKPTNKHFAYLKISEGCDQNCTYCTIPGIRGRYRSRTTESLVQEAEILAKQGVRELIIVAQDTTRYGIDIYGKISLHTLLQELSDITELHWLRILYAYPEHITQELIEEMGKNPKVLPYLDMPIQHSHTEILQAMGRNMTGSRIREIIANLRSSVPNIALRTTLIVGFPGEEEKHFLDLVEFIKEIRFDRLGVFTYSGEEGTVAAAMENQIAEVVKHERKDVIMQVQEEISKQKLQEKVGSVMEAIVDKRYGANSYFARTYMDCYDIDGSLSFSTCKNIKIGDFVQVKITHSLSHDLTGELL